MNDLGRSPRLSKLRVLMMCAHAPALDPRIRWEAEAASPRFDVTVLGFLRQDGRGGDVEGDDCYTSILLPSADRGSVEYLWQLKQVVPYPHRILFTVLLALISLPLGLTDQAARLTALLQSTVGRAATSGAATLPGKFVMPVLEAVNRRLPARIYHILSCLRHRFSPATVLFWRIIRDMPEKPEIVHCNDLDTLLVGVLAKIWYGCRLVYDAHEFYPHSDPSGGWLDISFFSMIERLLIRRADAVVTVNRLLAEAIREAYGLPKVHVVANAEPWNGPYAKPVCTEMDRLASGRRKFLFQGRFAPGRGIDELITAWAKVDITRAALFLRGPDNMWRRRAMMLAAELHLLDRSVYFLDAVTEHQLISAAAEADVGIIPYLPLLINDQLSCPNKLSQYLHAGLMIVANDLTFVRSVVTEAQAGLIYDSTRPDSLINVVNRIVYDPELLCRSQANALRFARERFNWQNEGEKLYALYNDPEKDFEVVTETIIAPAAQ